MASRRLEERRARQAKRFYVSSDSEEEHAGNAYGYGRGSVAAVRQQDGYDYELAEQIASSCCCSRQLLLIAHDS
eukprot:COSAG02_NODE_91_length_37690_cov_91.664840_15_plen_74_part_00